MIGVVVVSHGRLASELLRAAELIVGTFEASAAVDIDPAMGMEQIRKAVEGAIRAVDSGAGVLLLTDMFGGTPSNIALSFLGSGEVEVVTGINLPMLVKLGMARGDADLPSLARQIQEYGQRNITIPGELLRKKTDRK